MRKTRAGFLAWAIGLMVLSGPAGAQEKVRFVLDWAFQGQQAMFTVPVDDGTYQRHGLAVTVDRGVGSGDSVSKVASGAYDIALADLYSMVRFNGQNPDRPLIAVMLVHDKSALAVETKSNSGINSPKDLNGKTMAAPVGDASRQLFPLFAEINGVDQNSIKWVNVSPELRETMLIRGEAHAISGHITTVMMNMRGINVPASDIRVMAYADYGVGLYGHALVVKPEYAEKNPETIRKFITASMQGLRVMMKDPDAAVASIKKRDPLINEPVERDRIKMSLDYMFITPQVMQNGVSNADIPRLENSIKQAAKAFGIEKVPTAAQVYTDKYLPPRGELKVN